MSILEQLEQARADVAALEGDTAKLESNLEQQATDLEGVRRAARSGAATFEAVVKQQARREAAQGMLTQHLQDVAEAHALRDELEAALSAADLLAEGRAAYQVMREAETAHAARAEQIETELSAALAELHTLTERHRQAHARLSTALRQSVKAVHGREIYGQGNRLTVALSPERETGAAWLAQIDPALTEHEALMAGLGVSANRYPLLSKAGGRG